MKTNQSTKQPPQFTHEGAPSSPVPPIQQLRRSVMACMLWEDNFYEDGKSVVDRIEELCSRVKPEQIVSLALEAHERGFLRHVPLKLIVEALKQKAKCADAIYTICSRPDQMTELLSLYWLKGKRPLAKQLKKGLAKAFTRFDEYQLAKWDKDGKIKLRDVLFLCHAKPKDEVQADLWKRLINKTLKTPETWETKLSAGEKKDEAFAELLEKGKMGKQAILMNLRNMQQSGVEKSLVERELMKKSRPVLPFQFIAASKACPQWEDLIDRSMIQCLEGKDKLPGITVVFVDVSGSMDGGRISAKSETTCKDAASGLAILLREVCYNVEFFSFSNAIVFVPARRGMALRDAIFNSQPSGGTYLGAALNAWKGSRNSVQVDRLIVITDEQVADTLPKMGIPRCYIFNIQNCKNGIKNNGEWINISGFSPALIDYVQEIEKENDK